MVLCVCKESGEAQGPHWHLSRFQQVLSGVSPGWLKKPLTRNYRYESLCQVETLTTKEFSNGLLQCEFYPESLKEWRSNITSAAESDCWCALVGNGNFFFFLIQSIYNTHIECIAWPGTGARHFPSQLSRFHRSFSYELQPLDTFWRGKCSDARLLYRFIVPSVPAAEKLSLKMNGPQREWGHGRRRNGWAEDQRLM